LHASKAGALRRRIEHGWQADAACGDTDDPDAWFPPRTATAEDIAGPLSVCARCPVRRSCLAAGLLGREYGLWGGTIEAQRDAALGELNAGASVDSVLDQLLAIPALRVGRSKVYELMRAGSLRSVKIGGSRRISATALAEFVAALGQDLAWRRSAGQAAVETAKAPSISCRTAGGAARSSSATAKASRTAST